MKRNLPILAILLVTTVACAKSGDQDGEGKHAVLATRTDVPSDVKPSPFASAHALQAKEVFPKMVVHKSPSCGCCGLWVEHMRDAGFNVEVRDQDDLGPIKQALGIPYGKGSCHTAEVAGYFIEGHVPAEDVKRLLHEKPDAKGLVLPGMPAGSPGMEMPDGRSQAYAVEIVSKAGSTTIYARHDDVQRR